MSRYRLRRRLREFFRKLRDARKAARRQLFFLRLGLEPLEPRRLLTVRVWDGADVANGNDFHPQIRQQSDERTTDLAEPLDNDAGPFHR